MGEDFIGTPRYFTQGLSWISKLGFSQIHGRIHVLTLASGKLQTSEFPVPQQTQQKFKPNL
jgi:hypothetical protein